MNNLLKARLVSFLITPLFGYGFIQLFFFSDRPVTVQDTTQVEGKLLSAQILKPTRNSEELELQLEGFDIPIRNGIGFPGSYRKDFREHLFPNATITARVENEDLQKSSGNYYFVALTANEQEILTMEDFNKAQSGNLLIGKFVTSTLTLLGVSLFGVSIFKPNLLDKD